VAIPSGSDCHIKLLLSSSYLLPQSNDLGIIDFHRMRLWDTNPEAIKMQSIWHDLRDKEVVDAIALDRARRLGFEDVFEQMREDIGKRADAVVALIGKYMEGGPRNNVLETLRALRHERLVHRQLSPATAPGASATDEEIEDFIRTIQSSAIFSRAL
jgi:hypothetical protein